MKITAALCLALQIALIGMEYIVSYCQGFYEKPNHLFLLLPLWVAPFYFLIFLTLGSLAMFSLGRNLHRFWVTSAFLTFFVILIVTNLILPAPGNMLAYGLRNRVMRDYTLDDLRKFAHDADQAGLLKESAPGSITPPAEALTQLEIKYPFIRSKDNWGPRLMNFGDEDVVNFVWGGALTGHWGCSIGIDGRKNEPDQVGHGLALPVSEDIYFFVLPY